MVSSIGLNIDYLKVLTIELFGHHPHIAIINFRILPKTTVLEHSLLL